MRFDPDSKFFHFPPDGGVDGGESAAAAGDSVLGVMLAMLIPPVFVITGFGRLLWGFALLGVYSIKAPEWIFAPLREREENPENG